MGGAVPILRHTTYTFMSCIGLHLFIYIVIYLFTYLFIYRDVQKEKSVFLAVIVWAIARKRFYMNMCLVLNGYKNRAL